MWPQELDALGMMQCYFNIPELEQEFILFLFLEQIKM